MFFRFSVFYHFCYRCCPLLRPLSHASPSDTLYAHLSRCCSSRLSWYQEGLCGALGARFWIKGSHIGERLRCSPGLLDRVEHRSCPLQQMDGHRRRHHLRDQRSKQPKDTHTSVDCGALFSRRLPPGRLLIPDTFSSELIDRHFAVICGAANQAGAIDP